MTGRIALLGMGIALTLIASSVRCGPASSAAPEFPDLSGYSQTNPGDYRITAYVGSAYRFTTPDGLHCEIAEPHYQPLHFYCDGSLPGVPDGVDQVRASAVPAESFAQSSKNPSASCAPRRNSGPETAGPPLPPMHYIAVLGITCAVDGAGTTACRTDQPGPNGRRWGFLLSPNGSAIL
jgi:hypothetical protein